MLLFLRVLTGSTYTRINPYQLKDGFNLKTLDISHNKLNKLSPSSFLTSLETIYLNNNYIEEILANTFLQMDTLRRVELAQNSLVRGCKLIT